MATGRIILASKLKVYNKILKHGIKIHLLNPDNIDDWIQTIYKNFKTNRFIMVGKNAMSESIMERKSKKNCLILSK